MRCVYDPGTLRQTGDSSGFTGRTLARAYDTAPGVVGRPALVSVGPTGGANDYTVRYGYDAQGRLNLVTGPGLPDAVGYTFLDQTDLVRETAFKNGTSDQLLAV